MSWTANIEKAISHPEWVVRKAERVSSQIWEDFKKTTQYSIKEIPLVNQKEFRVLGLKRTGNHAIINWFQSQEPGIIWHLNNLIPNENPYRYKYRHLKDHYPQHSWMIEQYRKEAQEQLSPKNCLIYSYEDYAIEDVSSNAFEKKHDIYLGRTKERYDILIIRDPFNLFASRLRNNFLAVNSKKKDMVELWIDYAREYLGETQQLKHRKICINYNQWVSDKNYRKMLTEQSKTPFTDTGFDKVSSHGGGSSFDGQEFNGQASQMDILNRWKFLLEDLEYRQLFKNQQVWDYSEKIFGHIAGTEFLRD